MAKKQSTDLALVVLGIIAWVIAIFFGAVQITVEASQATEAGRHATLVRLPNVAAAGAACGFAIAGGLCFVGAVLASRSSRRESPPTPESFDQSSIPETRH